MRHVRQASRYRTVVRTPRGLRRELQPHQTAARRCGLSIALPSSLHRATDPSSPRGSAPRFSPGAVSRKAPCSSAGARALGEWPATQRSQAQHSDRSSLCPEHTAPLADNTPVDLAACGSAQVAVCLTSRSCRHARAAVHFREAYGLGRTCVRHSFKSLGRPALHQRKEPNADTRLCQLPNRPESWPSQQ